ncbi:PH domain-containing protein [Yeosuana marina]|uniref:PH domain-containing protein n=1 Tax=Yeosuana marina TaxID=1565536 RepID=UPI0030C80A42
MSIVILVLTAIFIIHLFFSTKYMIVDDILKIRSGFIYKKDLEIKKILSISKSSTLISSPAASFDRIEIKYGQFSSVVISPKDKISLIEELIKINPDIKNQISLKN